MARLALPLLMSCPTGGRANQPALPFPPFCRAGRLIRMHLSFPLPRCLRSVCNPRRAVCCRERNRPRRTYGLRGAMDTKEVGVLNATTNATTNRTTSTTIHMLKRYRMVSLRFMWTGGGTDGTTLITLRLSRHRFLKEARNSRPSTSSKTFNASTISTP
ncbi:hypothetical protein QBC46DRAFT_359528 [Diplogelasinospora grovesii]|uniref:Uncharacterized protein n=1 Tax=Diplogelasinospora grovesii TaxID=303347 RepID=A0AAN6MW50_9PEZI|nr:hypothetical protein QBC46DRAFT_359528 [Diplogelasinospora grovesii]